MFRRISLVAMMPLLAFATSVAIAESQNSQERVSRIELPGFSVLPPTGSGWRPYSEPARVLWRCFPN
jgi:hypothetical protein